MPSHAAPAHTEPSHAALAQPPSFQALLDHAKPFQADPFHADPFHDLLLTEPCGHETPDQRLAFQVLAKLVTGESETVAPSRVSTEPTTDWPRFIGPAVAAAFAFRAPCPSTKGFPTGPGLVVPSSRALS